MSKSVIVYSKVGCGECMFTKKFLEANNIDFQEYNLTHQPELVDTVRELGFQSLPVVVVDGEDAFNGFQPDRLQALVG